MPDARATAISALSCARKLGDTPDRSYAEKLELFGDFVRPELREILARMRPPSDGLVLDLGCGVGTATALLAELVSEGFVVGLDLSLPHLQAARRRHTGNFLQGDAEKLCLRGRVFDFVWSCNTINHVGDGVAVLRSVQEHVRPGGQIAIAQSGFLPEMYFAWDSHLDDAVRLACHRYYRDRYGLEPKDTAPLRRLLGLMRAAGIGRIETETHVIERTPPLSQADREYFLRTIFEGSWGERLEPYLDSESRSKLDAYCDPGSPQYCLDRDDFHHIQTITVCKGRVPA